MSRTKSLPQYLGKDGVTGLNPLLPLRQTCARDILTGQVSFMQSMKMRRLTAPQKSFMMSTIDSRNEFENSKANIMPSALCHKVQSMQALEPISCNH